MAKKLRWVIGFMIIGGMLWTGTLAFAKKEVVVISNKGHYYQVTIDFCKKPDHGKIGVEYGKQLKIAVLDFEALVDSYLTEVTGDKGTYDFMMARAKDILPQVPPDYRDEWEGMAKGMNLGKDNQRGDNQLSADELMLFNLVPDVLRGTQCSFVSVFGSRSATHKTISGRVLDYYGGSQNQLPKIQAVTTIKYETRQICLIGYLGYFGVISGFNNSKIFAAILDSATGAPYSSQGKRSYPMDLRQALETKTTLAGVAQWMTDPGKNYPFNHLIALSDPIESKILENNISGTGTNMQRALRSSDSLLNEGIFWEIRNTVVSVNSFVLKGNHDNHTASPDNTARWERLKVEILAKGNEVSREQVKELVSFDNGDGPGARTTGDIYNPGTQQIIIFEPDTLSLEVFFRPKDSLSLPSDPVFEKVAGF